ncbi:hypothetical protein SORBI_3001G092400 [Sorghum bicolor]|uniref:Uncharacterized protein n=1 Tax=Sorghum bicolor TaxID=4558 RepID=A0A1B6QI51_SORBI|nr:hypothetical protein SORBI_3001G092400 [Sorghum bicolor]
MCGFQAGGPGSAVFFSTSTYVGRQETLSIRVRLLRRPAPACVCVSAGRLQGYTASTRWTGSRLSPLTF